MGALDFETKATLWATGHKLRVIEKDGRKRVQLIRRDLSEHGLRDVCIMQSPWFEHGHGTREAGEVLRLADAYQRELGRAIRDLRRQIPEEDR